MTTTISADQLLVNINQLIEENVSSLLNFTAEKEKAQQLVNSQHDKVAQLQRLNQEMIKMQEHSEVSIDEIKNLKSIFDQNYQAYQEEYHALKTLYLTISVSFTTEKYILKRCFFDESDYVLSQIMEKASDQDVEIAQLNEVISSIEE
ncbi:hypothetical protein [Candidatus Enterococcus murrayae]|uniref:Uncharacterized protein n=1 Tax=Candidatus Enterococcus murrayae TaxID=2815321 RepID=A0ABS3HF28_9ENTE|nr:hypothetical protein [Enterococcus sp. MJM16]MBO0452061.1 hypothetical protein [Enterococcus sp. MJM16]